MACSASMQISALSSSLALKNVEKGINFKPNAFFVPTRRISNYTRVRCMAEDGNQKEESTSESISPPQPIPTPTPPPRPSAPKVSTKFSDVFAFSGPAPERINGRLAMVGFVAALAVEFSNGNDVFAQISNGGVSWFVATSVVLSIASLVPLLQGVTVESKSNGIMTSNAELWNGRFAMLGLVALAFTEFVKGGTLV